MTLEWFYNFGGTIILKMVAIFKITGHYLKKIITYINIV